MTPGKMASQSAHAAKNCCILASKYNPELLRLYQGIKFLGTQIILQSKDERQLLHAYEAAKSVDLITSLIIDENHILLPHFTGAPIITALGIGPCTKAQVNHITKKFQLVK